jgi:EF-P beta-lysylation protein EpmB
MPHPIIELTLDQHADEADWRHEMREAVRDATELCKLLELPTSTLESSLRADRNFRLLTTRSYIARMRRGDPQDPLLLQVLPQVAELLDTPGFVHDPVGDLDASAAPGILHKYRGRALLITTASCAVHCRYCFRRHFPYAEENASTADWQPSLSWLAAHEDIREVILSGGDPLMLADARLERLLAGLQQLEHVQTIRLHTRLPVVLPSRINPALCQLMAKSSKRIVCVLHANHANEVDVQVQQACVKLRDAGATLLNQSVLLAAINDNVPALTALSERLFACGVLPYYLHQLDPVQGAAHFAVDDNRALALMKALRRELPGYLVPRLVREIPGETSKTPLFA